MAEKDPLTQVYEGIWEQIENRRTLHDLIPVGNRINFLDVDLAKLNELPADTPQIMVTPAGTFAAPENTSNSSFFTEQFDVRLSVGGLVLANYFKIKFEAYRALIDWRTHNATLTWAGKSFFVHSTIGSIDDVINDALAIRGWLSILRIEVMLSFSTLELIGVGD